MAKNLTEFINNVVISQIAQELGIDGKAVENTLRLLVDDCTVPFIARYRKEMTEGLNEVQIRDIRDQFDYIVALLERREVVLRSIEEQGKLTDELRVKIFACGTKSQLEDVYLPYKPRKRTRGQIARERGLEPLANKLMAQDDPSLIPEEAAAAFVGVHEEVTSVEIAIAGARDLLAEGLSETAEIRGELRQWMFDTAKFRAIVRDEFADRRTKFHDYYDFSEPVSSIAPHRLMALRRGEKEEILRVTIECDVEMACGMILRRIVRETTSPQVLKFLQDCVEDSYARLLAPSVETELRLETRSKAEEEAIRVFAKNLRNLLLLPPIPKRLVVGIDPGIRTGSKIVVVSNTGHLMEWATVYPDTDQSPDVPKNATAREKILDTIRRNKSEYVAIGNGTGGRELHGFVEKILESAGLNLVRVIVVNEAGASVYSASEVARDEFPDLDITYRGAVSIARRLQDPLAELVKIDPKSIGVGQYQHDVNQSRLKRSLEDVVESCVNHVGVNLNTASPSLLSYVSGIGPALARNIVEFRNRGGEISSRRGLLDIPGFGSKTFEQAAGFLRVPDAENPLDNSAVHPERYSFVERLATDLGVEVKQLVGNKELIDTVDASRYVSDDIGLLTISDILKELVKPGRDPRAEGIRHTYNRNVRSFDDLKEGQVVLGTVTNVTNFGAFVDIGVHQDGLIHISEISNRFIKNPVEAIAVGEIVKVKVIAVDRERKRINLSRRALEGTGFGSGTPGATGITEPTTEEHPKKQASTERSAQGTKRESTKPRTRGPRKQGGRPENQQSAASTVSDLLTKFNNGRM